MDQGKPVTDEWWPFNVPKIPTSERKVEDMSKKKKDKKAKAAKKAEQVQTQAEDLSELILGITAPGFTQHNRMELVGQLVGRLRPDWQDDPVIVRAGEMAGLLAPS